MPLICPRCNGRVSTLDVRAAFLCSACGVKLRSSYSHIVIVAVIAAVFGEVGLVILLTTVLGNTLTAIYVWSSGLPIAGVVALVVYWFVVRTLCRFILVPE